MAYLNDQNRVIRVSPTNKNPTLVSLTPAMLKTSVSEIKGLVKRNANLVIMIKRQLSQEATEKTISLNEKRDKILNINSGLP